MSSAKLPSAKRGRAATLPTPPRPRKRICRNFPPRQRLRARDPKRLTCRGGVSLFPDSEDPLIRNLQIHFLVEDAGFLADDDPAEPLRLGRARDQKLQPSRVGRKIENQLR